MEQTPDALTPLLALRQHSQAGVRSPHKPLLVLLALAQLDVSGSSTIAWSTAEEKLAALIRDFGPPSKTAANQSAAYPFTRLRSDGVWTLDHDVPMDRVGPLSEFDVAGSFTEEVEQSLRSDPTRLYRTASALVEAEFPSSIAPDVLTAVGLDPEVVLGSAHDTAPTIRRRSAAWPSHILTAWNRQCAFCGFDGQLGTGSVGIEAAHVRWFNFDGPDEMDNGLALCSLHHKLFDRGALGLTENLRIDVSRSYTARTEAGKRVYDLLDRSLTPRPGTPLPALDHVQWHRNQVFKEGSAAA